MVFNAVGGGTGSGLGSLLLEVHRIVDIINEEKVILAVSSEFSLPLPTNDKFQEAE